VVHYVTEGAWQDLARRSTDREVTTFASGLPPVIIGIGGAIDVAFIDNIALSPSQRSFVPQQQR
jgi:hypothetical protein